MNDSRGAETIDTTRDERRDRARRRHRRLRRRGGIATAVNIAPMIDVSFLLLIFFLVTTTFERAEGILASDLPRRRGGQPGVTLPISPMVIRLTPPRGGDEGYALSVDRFPQAPPRIEALPAFLRGVHEMPGFDRDTPVVIVADNDVRWDFVVQCWNAAIRAECRKIAFAEP
jgi:biopolymer transport protein ExbD